MHFAACIFLLRMVDVRMEVSLQGLLAAGRVGVEPTTRLDSEISGFLHRADGEIPDRLHDGSPLTAHPCDHGRPVFVIMAPTGLAFLPATPRPTSQVFFAPLCRLPLIPSGVIE